MTRCGATIYALRVGFCVGAAASSAGGLCTGPQLVVRILAESGSENGKRFAIMTVGEIPGGTRTQASLEWRPLLPFAVARRCRSLPLFGNSLGKIGKDAIRYVGMVCG